MSPFDLPHDGPIHIIADDRFEVAFYAHDGKKYRAWRELGLQTWKEARIEEISADSFYMLVACVQRRKWGARGLA